MKPNVKMSDGRPAKTMRALQYTEIDIVLAVPAPGRQLAAASAVDIVSERQRPLWRRRSAGMRHV